MRHARRKEGLPRSEGGGIIRGRNPLFHLDGNDWLQQVSKNENYNRSGFFYHKDGHLNLPGNVLFATALKQKLEEVNVITKSKSYFYFNWTKNELAVFFFDEKKRPVTSIVAYTEGEIIPYNSTVDFLERTHDYLRSWTPLIIDCGAYARYVYATCNPVLSTLS